MKNSKKYAVTQRFNLLNQKIIGNLETQHNFNRESLLRSIKNNKHNYLTATYYLLLKKHMIRQCKKYYEAFFELKLKEEPKDGAGTTDLDQVNTRNQRGTAQPPPVHLKSKQVQEAL